MEALGKRVCAVYTRKSTEDGLEQTFNTLDAQREACESYIRSQKHEGWEVYDGSYDDGGYSGGTLERPALRRLLADIQAGKVHIIVVYKIDRLTRSLADFAKIVELLDKYGVTFVSITQQFNTTTSMGRLTLNVLLSFAQFEREVAGERIRDKIAASKAKGMWMGGFVPMGYQNHDRKLVVQAKDAQRVQRMFQRYLELESVYLLHNEVKAAPHLWLEEGRGESKPRALGITVLYRILQNPIYIGKLRHKNTVHQGQHEAIIDINTWKQVQQLLSENSKKLEHSLKAQSPSRLMGKLFDAEGNSFESVHGNKNKKRYRYYTNRKLKSVQAEVMGMRRIPAHELDHLVERQFLALLAPAVLEDRFKPLGLNYLAPILDQGHQLLESWLGLMLHERNVLIRECLVKIVIHLDQVEIIWDANRFFHMILKLQLPSETRMADWIRESVPVKLAQVRTRNKLIMGDKHDEVEASPALVADVCKAYIWNQKLLNREYSTIKELAEAEGKDLTYVSAMMRFAWLAPDIVEAIINGTEPRAFMVRSIRKIKTANWVDQRQIIDSME